MDAFFGGLDSRLRLSVKAADSIMVGLVNAAMEDAYKKSLWKDGDLDRLFQKLRFAELAIMQLEWCLRFVRGEMEADGAGADDGHDDNEQLLDDLLETRDRIQERLDEAELAVAETDRDYMRRKREELAGPSRGREAPPPFDRLSAEEEEEDGGLAFLELRGSVIRKMSRMRARLEDASSSLAALMEKVSGEASPMARLQEAGHEGEGVKGLSGFYSMAQLLMEFQEMVLDAGTVRDSVASSFDAIERSFTTLRAAMDEQQWLMDAEREMYSTVVEGFVRDINVGSNRTSSSPCEGSCPPTLHHDSNATEKSPETFLLSPKDETRQLQSARHIVAEKSESRQCYHSQEHCIRLEEAERLTEEQIDSDVRSELQCVLYTAVFIDLVTKLSVQAYDIQKLKEENDEMDVTSKLQREIYGSIFKESLKVTEGRDEVDIRSELQNEIYSIIVEDLLKEVAVDHRIKTFIRDEVHAVSLTKILNAWKSTTEMTHNERFIKEEIDRILFGGLTKDLISGHNFRVTKPYGEIGPRNDLEIFSMIDNIKQFKKVNMQINAGVEGESPDSDQHEVPVKQEVLSLSANHGSQNSKGSNQKAETSADKDDVSDPVKNNIEEGLKDQRKVQMGEMDTSFSMLPDRTNKDMFILTNKFQAMFMYFEAFTCEKLGTAVLRLRDLDKQLENLAGQVASLKKSEHIYRTAFTRRCCDLQTAEAEVRNFGFSPKALNAKMEILILGCHKPQVDLLGDEVELLLGLLSKTYKALDHHSPVLQHYLGVFF
ncbi:hypothetical protein HU200_031578 [Digitaria exilis]|uniref:Uncharacterized protein n=1 Tax=Digitaria exilis TaxID=1010633 RepID=A0A835EQ04_9POAL|nr:hypothetical protein HU200_031578 [Digitaria exilis]